jgi:hypothetical protein
MLYSIHVKKMFSVKPFDLPDIRVAAKNGAVQHPNIFHTDETNSGTC